MRMRIEGVDLVKKVHFFWTGVSVKLRFFFGLSCQDYPFEVAVQFTCLSPAGFYCAKSGNGDTGSRWGNSEVAAG